MHGFFEKLGIYEKLKPKLIKVGMGHSRNESKEELAYAKSEEVVAALTILKAEFNLAPMDDPFTYVKTLQKDFPYHEIPLEEESDCFPETEHEPFSF